MRKSRNSSPGPLKKLSQLIIWCNRRPKISASSIMHLLKSQLVVEFTKCSAETSAVALTSDDKDCEIWGKLSTNPPLDCNSFFQHTTLQMATSRVATSVLLRAPRCSIPHAARTFRALPAQTRLVAPAVRTFSPRFYSSEAPKPSKIYFFQDVRPLIAHNRFTWPNF